MILSILHFSQQSVDFVEECESAACLLRSVLVLNAQVTQTSDKHLVYACLSVLFQVIAGAGMDVDFAIISPDGSHVIMEARHSDGVHV